jgi:hypothetical protein
MLRVALLSIELLIVVMVNVVTTQHLTCYILLIFINIVGIVRYHQASAGTAKAQKSILMFRFQMVISWYFIALVLDHQYWVSERIILESICLNFSQYQTCYA